MRTAILNTADLGAGQDVGRESMVRTSELFICVETSGAIMLNNMA